MSKNKILLKALGSVESNNNPKAMNKQSSATGEIQMMWSQWGNKIRKFAGNPNLTREQFANDTDLQNRWADYYVETVLKPEAAKLEKRYPDQLKQQGLTNPEDVQTLIHFQGYPRSSRFLRSGLEEQTQEKNLAIPEYIKRARKKREELSAPPKITPPTPKPSPSQGSPNLAESQPRLQFKPDERKKPELMDQFLGVLSNFFVSEAEGSGGSAILALPDPGPDEYVPSTAPSTKKPSIRISQTKDSTVDSDITPTTQIAETATPSSVPVSEPKPKSGFSLSAKPLKNVPSGTSYVPPGFTPEEWQKEQAQTQEPEQEDPELTRKKAKYPELYSNSMSMSEAAWRAAVQGGLADFGDEAMAAFDTLKNAQSDNPESWEEATEKARIPFERARMEHPYAYYPVTILTSIVAGLTTPWGWAGNALRIKNAATLVMNLKRAGTVGKELKSAQSLLNIQRVRGVAQQSAIGALGSSEKSLLTDPLGTTEDVAFGTLVGTGTAAALGKATDLLVNSPTAQKVASTTWKTTKDAILGKSKKWKIDESHLTPESYKFRGVDLNEDIPEPKIDLLKSESAQYNEWQDYEKKLRALETARQNMLSGYQKEIDQLVSQGQKEGLTEQQILNNIIKKIPTLNPETINTLVNPPGVRQGLKNVIAGGSKASQFLGDEKQRQRAERLATETGQVSPDVAILENAEEEATRAVALAREYRTNIINQNQEIKDNIAKEMQSVNDQLKTEKNAIRKEELKRKRTGLVQKANALAEIIEKQNKISALETTIEDQQKFALNAVDRLRKERTSKHLNDVKNLATKLEDQVVDLANQRSAVVEKLANKEATPDMIAAFQNVNDKVNERIDKLGMKDIRNQVYEYAFAGDPRVTKINKHLEALKNVAENLEIQKQNKLGSDKFGPTFQPRELIAVNQEDLKPPSAQDLVEALLIANKKISSPANGNPAASIKRELGEIVQEHMRLIDEDVYVIQRGIANTKSNLKTIYSSGLFNQRYVPQVGKTGRTTAIRKPFIKTNIPDFTEVSDDYLKVLKEMGVPTEDIVSTVKLKNPELKNAEAWDYVESLGFGRSAGDMSSAKTSITEATKNISDLQNEIKSLERFRENLKRDLRLQSGYDKDRTMKLEEEANKRIEYFKNKLDEQEKNFKKLEFEASQREMDALITSKRAQEKTSTLKQTESELKDIYQQSTGIPATARDVGQTAVIGARGEIPFGIGKLAPSANARIKLFNKIEKNFKNPSLNAAVRAVISRPVTDAMVRSLAQTHKVDLDTLLNIFQESGVEIIPDEVE